MLQCSLLVVAPGEDDADVAGHPAREIDDLIKNAVAAWLQIVRPKLINLKGNTRQRLFPTGLSLIDGAAAIGTKRVGKAVHLHLAKAVTNRALNHIRGELYLLLLRQAGGFA